MKFQKTGIEEIANMRRKYLNSLPLFQELFLELMVGDSDIYLVKNDSVTAGYAIITPLDVMIEFYLEDPYIPGSHNIFKKLVEDLSVSSVYCKSFDHYLLNNCLKSSFSYEVIGILYRDYNGSSLKPDPEISMVMADNTSIEILMKQDGSIRELFETRDQLTTFIETEKVYLFFRKEELAGCGMVIRTHKDFPFCDIGVWVHPSQRRMGTGSQILHRLREFALENSLKPSCGCAAENIPSQKTIEKSGFISNHSMLEFRVD